MGIHYWYIHIDSKIIAFQPNEKKNTILQYMSRFQVMTLDID